MRITVYIDSATRNPALARFVKERAEQTLMRHARGVEKVEIRIRDLNGVKGGVDKECKITVLTNLSAPVIVTAEHSEPGQAFRAALKKLVPNLRSTMDRSIFKEKRARGRVRRFKEAA